MKERTAPNGHPEMAFVLAALLAPVLLAAACAAPGLPGPVVAPVTPTGLPPDTPTPFKPSPDEEPPWLPAEGSIRLMTYNVEFGAGYTRRLDQVLAVIQAYRPDILALQELNRWGAGEPSRIALVAEELDMGYVFCDSDSLAGDDPEDSFDTAILTRFEIVDAAAYPDVVHCLARAEIQLPDGSRLQAFSVHFHPRFDDSGCRNPQRMLEDIRTFQDGKALILGDFNLPAPGDDQTWFGEIFRECAALIERSGWVFIAQNIIEIDQLWASPALQGQAFLAFPDPENDLAPSHELLSTASDHFPLVVDMTFPGTYAVRTELGNN